MTSKPNRSFPALFQKARTSGIRVGRQTLSSLRRSFSRQPSGLVRVIYQGRMGNQLFQYCLGRRIARDLGFTLYADPIAGFPGTQWTGVVTPAVWGFRSPREQLRGHTIDLAATLANPTLREIALWGYFEKYTYYRDAKGAIRDWLSCPTKVVAPNAGDVVIHVRSGDIWLNSSSTRPSPIHAAVPVSYYKRVLSVMKPDRVLLVTENPRDPVAQKLRDVCGATIVGGSAMEDYALLLASNRIILSMSTFAWWGAWLSQASEIHMPLWAGWHPDSKRSPTDLRVTDEDRYVFHDLGLRDDWRGDAADLERTLIH